MTVITRDILPFAEIQGHSSFPRGRHGGRGAEEAGMQRVVSEGGLGNQGKDGAAERQGFDLFYGYYNQWHAHTYYTHLFRNSKRSN